MNLYVTPTEIKGVMPDGIRAATTKYDASIISVCRQASRFIDRYCERTFYPRSGVRYFRGNGKAVMTIDDVISVTKVEISDDDGATYSELALNTDYRLTWWGDPNDPRSWTQVEIDPNSTQGTFPTGYRALKVTGVWAYADDRDTAWEDSLIDIAAQLAAAAVTMSITDVTAKDAWGLATALHTGRLIKIGDEIIEVTGVTDNASPPDAAAILRGRNGSTDALHASASSIYLWRPPEPIKQVAGILTVRAAERGYQGFGDARANPEVGQMFFLKALDPEARGILELYRRMRAD